MNCESCLVLSRYINIYLLSSIKNTSYDHLKSFSVELLAGHIFHYSSTNVP